MFTNLQKQAIRNLMTQPGWDIMMELVGKFNDKWNEEDIKKDNEFETLWAVAQREAKGRALLEFFNELEKNVNE